MWNSAIHSNTHSNDVDAKLVGMNVVALLQRDREADGCWSEKAYRRWCLCKRGGERKGEGEKSSESKHGFPPRGWLLGLSHYGELSNGRCFSSFQSQKIDSIWKV